MMSSDLHSDYEKIRQVLLSAGYTVEVYTDIPYGLQFYVSHDSWTGLLRIYQNKKGVVRRDYSQLKGEQSQKVASLIEIDKHGSDNKGKSAQSTRQDVITELGFPIIGTDESGKGDYFGPLVAAGVYVNAATAKVLAEIGVKDSKNLSDKKNTELAQQVMQIVKGHSAIIEISPEKYNALYDQFRREKKNLNTLLAWGHAKAIEEILLKIDCSVAIADQFADESFILGKLQERGKKLKLIQMPKAEQNIAVAAASILARSRFLDRLSKLSKEYGVELPKGASSVVVEVANVLVNKNGKDILRKIAKLHFKTTANIMNL